MNLTSQSFDKVDPDFVEMFAWLPMWALKGRRTVGRDWSWHNLRCLEFISDPSSSIMPFSSFVHDFLKDGVYKTDVIL